MGKTAGRKSIGEAREGMCRGVKDAGFHRGEGARGPS